MRFTVGSFIAHMCSSVSSCGLTKLAVLYFIKGGHLIGQGSTKMSIEPFYWGCCLFVSGSVWYGRWQHLSLLPSDGHQWQFPILGSSLQRGFGEEIRGSGGLGCVCRGFLQLCVLMFCSSLG